MVLSFTPAQDSGASIHSARVIWHQGYQRKFAFADPEIQPHYSVPKVCHLELPPGVITAGDAYLFRMGTYGGNSFRASAYLSSMLCGLSTFRPYKM
jgi:hypothetical protein